MASSLRETPTAGWLYSRAQVVAFIRLIHFGCQMEIEIGTERYVAACELTADAHCH